MIMSEMGAHPNKERVNTSEAIAIIFYYENAHTINVLYDLWQQLGPYARETLEQVRPGITERVEEAIKR